MAIDFKRIKTGDDFELLVKDLFSSQRIEIVSGPGVGPDGGVDLIIRLPSTDIFQNTTYSIYVVQCKHYAKGGGSVGPSDIAVWRDVCDMNNADGYFLITSTQTTTKARKMLKEAKGFDNIIWDKSDLAKQIANSPEYADIVSRYNLQDSIEILFNQAKSMLLGEYHLPFHHSETLEEDTYKGLIFTKSELNSEFKTITKKIGYFCFLDLENTSFIQTIIDSYDIDEIHIIDDSKLHANSISLTELYTQLQGYRDTYYQDAIWTAISYSPNNPAGVRVIESCLRNMPYAPQNSTIINLQTIIQLDASRYDIYFIAEAAKAVAKLDIQTAKDSLISQLKKADQWGLDKTKTSFLAQNLVGALIELDREHKACVDQAFDILSTVVNVQIKAEIIHYFIDLKVEDKEGVIMSFFDKHKGSEFPPRNHGTNYNPQRVFLFEQAYPLDIDGLKKSYYTSVE